MGIFSKTCEYAVRAVFFIAKQTADGSKVGLREIAFSIDSPEHFLAKILQDLSKKGIIQSAKGPNGGFYLDAQGLSRSLSEVIEAVDGGGLFRDCGLGLKECSSINPCPLHHDFLAVRNRLKNMLESITIGQFNEDLNLGTVVLKK